MKIVFGIAQYLMAFILGVIVGSLVNAVSRHFLNGHSNTNDGWTQLRSLKALLPITVVTLVDSFSQEKLTPDRSIGCTRNEVIVELICGIGSVAIFIKFGFSSSFFALIFFCASLLAIFRIDLDKMIIPDAISVNGVWLGFLLSATGSIPYMDWKLSLYGTVSGAVILYVPAYAYRLIRGSDGLGGGDIKLMSMVGAFTGIQGVIFTLFVASLAGCLVGLTGFIYRRISANSLIPFGPFISSSAIMYVFFGQTIIHDFFDLLGNL
ncbi:MAG: A24 family peptidase [Deltaproteobacteria bacterium]|nr:A24 family peptidase [Deltaproteobacteria bacterium]